MQNGVCDDQNNKHSCGFDGGDCLVIEIMVNTSTTVAPTTLKACQYPTSVNDGWCDDYTNNPECEYDGGDCCDIDAYFFLCDDCLCLGDGRKKHLQFLQTIKVKVYVFFQRLI